MNHVSSIPRHLVQRSLKEMFEECVERAGDSPALVTEGHCLSYSELNRRSNVLGHSILGKMSAPGQIIAVLQSDLALTLVCTFAVHKTGNALLTLDPNAPASYQGQILKDAAPRLLLTSRDGYHDERIPSIKDLEVLLADEILANGNDEEGTNPDRSVPPDSLARVVYTSGSTGKPKGFAHQQFFMAHMAETYRRTHPVSEETRVLFVSPISHALGSNQAHYMLLSGAGLYAYPLLEKGIAGIASFIHGNSLTYLHTVPTVYRSILSNRPDKSLLSSMRLIHLGGEQCTGEDLRLFLEYFPEEALFVNNLGSTELSTTCQFHFHKGDPVPAGLVPIGRPVFDKEVTIRRTDGTIAAPGETGEIVVRTKYMALSFAEGKATGIDSNGSEPGIREFATGDLGTCGEDGLIYHKGRKGTLCKIHGHRVELTELEAEARSHPDVTEAIALVTSSTGSSSALLLYYTGERDPSDSVPELQKWLLSRLPYYMIPARLIWMESFPLLPSGKVDRRALPLPAATEENMEDPLEAHLAEVWKKTLSLDRVGRDDEFMLVGGDSMLAATLLARLEQTLGIRLPLNTIVDAPTIRTQAEAIRSMHPQSDKRFVVSLSRGKVPPLFVIHGWGGRVFSFLRFASHLQGMRTILGVQAEQLEKGMKPTLTSFEAMAREYATEIIATQRRGPYYLAGYSLGGILAFEVARQLHLRGKKVGRLFLIDPLPQRLPGSVRARMLAQYMTRRAFHHLRSLASNLRNPVHYLGGRIRAGVRIVHATKPQRVEPAAAQQPETIEDYYRKLGRLYTPRRAPIRATLIQSSINNHPFKNCWRYLATKECEIVIIPSEHSDLMKEPDVSLVVAAVEERLPTARRRARPSVEVA